MGDYSDYRVTQARMERAQERAQRQRRNAVIALGVLSVFAIVFGVAASIKRAPSAPPRLVVTWPSPEKYGKRTFSGLVDAEGIATLGRVLARPNQPFTVALANQAAWDASIVSPKSSSNGAAVTWRPADGETLKVFLRPAVTGWRRLFAWMQDKQELRLTAHVARRLDANRRALTLKQDGDTTRSIWLSSNVNVMSAGSQDQSFVWDERAVPLLEAINRAVPYAGPQPGPGRSMPLPPPRAPRWTLVHGFGNERAANDDASYFVLNAADALDDDAAITMTKMARQVAARAPEASIKWILSAVGSSGARATLRLEFDGSGARGGWVKRMGEASATPLRWWNRNLGESEIRERLAPSLPR